MCKVNSEVGASGKVVDLHLQQSAVHMEGSEISLGRDDIFRMVKCCPIFMELSSRVKLFNISTLKSMVSSYRTTMSDGGSTIIISEEEEELTVYAS